MLSPRPSVQILQEYHPPLAGRDGLRLDFNENTVGCSPRVLRCLTQITAEDLARYPERRPIEAMVALRLGMAGEQVLLTNGVDEAIHLMCEAYLEPREEVLVVAPTFSMYEIYAAATGARTVPVLCDHDFKFPLRKILRAITPATRMIAIASPNNPTGTAAGHDEIMQIAKAAPDAALLIDEAYYEFHGNTVVPAMEATTNLFVARTFSKAYGLAGLRIGLLCGPAAQIRWVRRIASPYNLNTVALKALSAALEDQEYVAGYVSEIIEQREHLASHLSELGIQYWPSAANFLLVNVGPQHREFVSLLRQHGILVRDRSSDPGCDGCVRITVGTRAQMRQLIAALKEVWAELGPLRKVTS